jgi:CRP-like cAMP-binding protein
MTLTSVVAKYLEELIDLLGAYAFHTAQQRIARLLVESAKHFGHVGREGIELDLTNEQLALAARTSRFTTSRTLSKWHKLGILKKHRGKIVLSCLSVFERIADGDA